MNNDLISRSALIKEFERFGYTYRVTNIIDNAPTVPLPDFKEGYKQAILDGKINYSRPKGEWRTRKQGDCPITSTCTNCQYEMK